MRKSAVVASNALIVLCLTLGFLFLAQRESRTRAESNLAAAEPTPIAVLKTILVNRETRVEASSSQVTVMRSQSSLAVSTGMPLFAGDEVSTGAGVKLTILFLDEAAETNNEVSLDQHTRVQLGSLFTWLGKVVVTVKGAFETKTTRARWGVRGTEYELVVETDGTNTLRVLKGAVACEEGNFSPPLSRISASDYVFQTVAFQPLDPLRGANELFKTPQSRRAPAPVSQGLVANKLDQVRLPPAQPFFKSAVPQSQLAQTINWTNEILSAGQPTYAPQSVVPHVPTWNEREGQFRSARRASILFGDEKSERALADVYLDWGKGAKAREELEKAVSGRPRTAEELTKLGEANRLMGNLTEAQSALRDALKLNANYARAYNEMGNVFMDRARVASETKAIELAKLHLRSARANFSRASEIAVNKDSRRKEIARRNLNHVRAGQDATNADTEQLVAKSNIGEADLELAKILQLEGRPADALRQYETAAQSFKEAEKNVEIYPFPTRGLGDVYRGIHSVAKRIGDNASANDAFRQSQQKYSQAIGVHKDFAEAYVGLGNLLVDANRPKEALPQFFQATRVRPDHPEGFYRVAIVLANEGDTRAASRYAGVYLKLQPAEFRSGFKAENARRVIQDRKPQPEPEAQATPPEETGSPTPPPQSPTPPDETATPSPSPVQTGTPIKIPGLEGDKPESALKELREKGLVPKLASYPDCKGNNKVVFSEPAKDQRVPRGTEVTVYVSSFGDDPVTVPRLKGSLLDSAEAMAERFGLTVRVERKEETDAVAPDTVTWQQPDPNKPYKRGCEIKVRVAIPVPKTEVPPLIGRNIGEAEQLLRNASLYQLTLEVDSDQEPGTVVDQSPSAGEIVPRRTLVTVRISSLGVVVPKVIGLSYTAASKLLTDRGLKVEVVEGDVEYGNCWDQNPPPGKRVPKGTVVKLKFPVGESLRE